MEASDNQAKYADKIAKLLRKAESTTPEEAELLVEKAQALMTQYAISEELIAKSRGLNLEQREEVIEESVTYTGIYHAAHYDIGSAIARANDCKVLISNRGKSTILYLIGHKSDVDRARMLDASVQIQAVGALTKWWQSQQYLGAVQHYTAMQKFKERRQFLFSFASGLSAQLARAAVEGRKAAQREEAARTSEQEAADSVALVVRDKKARVQDWVDEKYGKTLRSVSRNYSSGGYGASAAGHDAGSRADVSGKGKVRGGGGGQLGSGS